MATSAIGFSVRFTSTVTPRCAAGPGRVPAAWRLAWATGEPAGKQPVEAVGATAGRQHPGRQGADAGSSGGDGRGRGDSGVQVGLDPVRDVVGSEAVGRAQGGASSSAASAGTRHVAAAGAKELRQYRVTGAVGEKGGVVRVDRHGRRQQHDAVGDGAGLRLVVQDKHAAAINGQVPDQVQHARRLRVVQAAGRLVDQQDGIMDSAARMIRRAASGRARQIEQAAFQLSEQIVLAGTMQRARWTRSRSFRRRQRRTVARGFDQRVEHGHGEVAGMLLHQRGKRCGLVEGLAVEPQAAGVAGMGAGLAGERFE